MINIFFIYVIVWWMVFMAALPVGVKRDESPQSGHSTGAPKNPMLKKKILATSIIAAFFTWGIVKFIASGIINME